ncbi:hypothetical protein AGABI1DRAFT_132138 [Agaricus bisporus var. burnettii JB137-S8]|uniref:Uncharacterized protein n=1 Tax=Agaricus bisporus var. burnettii (strain JB137-S8 / ATCC MYA-4627 / FGSC 10392) TaxID=597362 RepID=K5WK13_AGABU|nr:uncharacterized protein AGABI1DRAFT_132138 [Agaricus bisporus var. burnettii JB137-S8]EKM75601.1 hypothetical protein AGABI1DRAFT_132138 [Agaricus bisporus var. burnettii JB137-S8]
MRYLLILVTHHPYKLYGLKPMIPHMPPQVKAFEKHEEEESTQDLLAGMQQQQQPGVSTTRRERSR